ncbi:transposase [Trichonephila clavipes]|nr:transposase [Trichonephila clavipes]
MISLRRVNGKVFDIEIARELDYDFIALQHQKWSTSLVKILCAISDAFDEAVAAILFMTDEAHLWLNGYVNKQNCRIWSEANPQVYVEAPLHPEKLTVWCALWAGGILLQKR